MLYKKLLKEVEAGTFFKKEERVENPDAFILERNHQKNVLPVTIVEATSSFNAKNIKGSSLETVPRNGCRMRSMKYREVG